MDTGCLFGKSLTSRTKALFENFSYEASSVVWRFRLKIELKRARTHRFVEISQIFRNSNDQGSKSNVKYVNAGVLFSFSSRSRNQPLVVIVSRLLSGHPVYQRGKEEVEGEEKHDRTSRRREKVH